MPATNTKDSHKPTDKTAVGCHNNTSAKACHHVCHSDCCRRQVKAQANTNNIHTVRWVGI